MEEKRLEKPVILEMAGIRKEFSGVSALSGITFDLRAGEIHCLVGENGAGKSTLMKVLSGAYTPDGGQIRLFGETFDSLTPTLSKERGINIIYQENDLVPTMNVVENIFVGSELVNSFGFVKSDEMFARTRAQMTDLGVELDLMSPVESLSVADQQFVKILKALSTEPKILIMDEPTSMFNVRDAHKVLALTEAVAARGIGIIYISHFLEEVRRIADRITVIRDGCVVNTYENPGRDIALTKLTRDMVGRPVETFYEKERHEIGGVMLEVRGLKLKKDSPLIDFTVRQGEILGFSGMVGSGRTEIVRALTGADPKYSGDIYIHGKKVEIHTPEDSIRAGFAHITEDRQKLGLMLGISVLENAAIVGLREKIKGFFINLAKLPPYFERLFRDLRVKTPSLWTEAIYLSGGNQQKVVLAKWLFADQEIYIFDEPTRGIDVNAKAEFYKQMSNLTRQGKCIIMISSDMPELISMSDRVLVIRDGKIHGELRDGEITEHMILEMALGVK